VSAKQAHTQTNVTPRCHKHPRQVWLRGTTPPNSP